MVANGAPTEYFQVDPSYPEAEPLMGNFNGELLNKEDRGMETHLAPGFYSEGKIGKQHAKEGLGDLVVEGISHEGWRQLLDAIDSVDGSRTQIAQVITQLPWITWERPQSGH